MEITIDISNHPEIAGVTRKASYLGIEINQEQKYVKLKVKVTHYVNNVLSSTIPSRTVTITADNSTRVNNLGEIQQEFELENGNIVFENDEPKKTLGFLNGIGEYDFFDAIAQSGNLLIYQLIQANILTADTRGRFGAGIYHS